MHPIQTVMNKQIYMHKNITPYKGKYYKNIQREIELAYMVMRDKEIWKSELQLRRCNFCEICVINA
jgi:hypothetical protein